MTQRRIIGDCGCNSTPLCPEEKKKENCNGTYDCDCAVKDLQTDCVVYNGPDIEETGIAKGTILTDVIIKLSSKFTVMKEYFENLFRISNVGSGVELYRGDDMLGMKEFKTLEGTGVTVVSEDAQKKNITIHTPEPIVYKAKSLGVNHIYKDETATVTEKTFNFKGIEGSESVDVTSKANTIEVGVNPTFVTNLKTEIKTEVTNEISNSGTYVKKVNGVGPDGSGNVNVTLPDTNISSNSLVVTEPVPDNWQIEIPQNVLETINKKTVITSSTLAVTKVNDYLYNIEAPMTEAIPSIIVNGKYTGTEVDGTESKPFKTIEDAVEHYIGSGDITNPERRGAKIVVRPDTYTLRRELTVMGINIESDNGVIIEVVRANMNSDWLIDMDIFPDIQAVVTLRGGTYNLYNIGGVRNSGWALSTPSTGTNFGKEVNIQNVMLRGETPVSKTAPLVANAVISAGWNKGARHNNGGRYFNIGEGTIYGRGQHKIIEIGNCAGVFFFTNTLISHSHYQTVNGTLNPSLVGIKIQAGDVRFTGCTLTGWDSELDTFMRYEGIGYQGGFLLNCIFEGHFKRLITFNPTTEGSNLRITGSSIGYTFIADYILYSATEWNKLEFNNNDFGRFGSLLNVDLTKNNTISVTNSFKGGIVESLVRYATKAEAMGTLPRGGVYILTNNSADKNQWSRQIVF